MPTLPLCKSCNSAQFEVVLHVLHVLHSPICQNKLLEDGNYSLVWI